MATNKEFNIDFKVNGLNQNIKTFDKLGESAKKAKEPIEDIPPMLKKNEEKIKEFNFAMHDLTITQKLWTENSRFTKNGVRDLGDTMLTVNKIQEDNIKIIKEKKLSEMEAFIQEKKLANERRKQNAEDKKVIDATTNLLTRLGTAVLDILIGPAKELGGFVSDTAKDIKNATSEVKGFYSVFDENKEVEYFDEQNLDIFDEKAIGIWKKEIKRLEKKGEKELAIRKKIGLQEKLDLRETEKYRRKILQADKDAHEADPIGNPFTHSPIMKNQQFLKDNKETEINFDKIVDIRKNETQKQYEEAGVSDSDVTYIAEANEVVIEAYAKRKTINQKHIQDQQKFKEEEKKINELQFSDEEITLEKRLVNAESFNDRKDELVGEANTSMSKFADSLKETNKAVVENAEETSVSFEEKWKGIHATLSKYNEMIMTGVNAIFSGMNAIFDEQLKEAKEKQADISKNYDDVVKQRQESSNKIKELEEKAKDAQGSNSLVLQEQIDREMDKNRQLANQETDLAKKKEKAQKEVEKKEKQKKKSELSQQIIQGIANTALGVTKAWSMGPIIGPILGALVGVAGAIQVAVMTKQLAKLQDGGLLNGKRHTQGGMRIEGTNIEVEGGEYVVNRESTSKNLGLVRYINSQRKELSPTDINSYFSKSAQSFEMPFSRKFESGGQVPVINNVSPIDNEALVDAIKSIKIAPKVAVTDIIRAQDEAVIIDGWSGM